MVGQRGSVKARYEGHTPVIPAFERWRQKNKEFEVIPWCLSYCSLAVKRHHEQGALQKAAFSWVLAYGFRGQSISIYDGVNDNGPRRLVFLLLSTQLVGLFGKD